MINYISDSWERIKNHCRATVNKDNIPGEPSDKFKENLLISEHSPIRLLEVDWTWKSIPYWVSTEWSRHKFEKFISTQRQDRTGKDRGKEPQEAPVNFNGYANAQHLIDSSRKRLCYQATPQARKLGEELKRDITDLEPQLGNVLVPNCIYRCGCPEFQQCGLFNAFKRECIKNDIDVTDIKERYQFYNEEFFK